MAHLITIQSYRPGIGKSTLAVNLATLLAKDGRRVLLIDTHFTSPSLHLLFGSEESPAHTLNQFLRGERTLNEVMVTLTPRLRLATDINGHLNLMPAASNQEGPNHENLSLDILSDALPTLIAENDFDYVIFDTEAGLHNPQMFQLALSHTLIAMMHPGRQDYQGTSVLLGLADELEIPTVNVVANEVPFSMDMRSVTAQIEQTYHCHHAFAIPYANELMALGSMGIFVLRYPEHDLTARVRTIADSLWVET